MIQILEKKSLKNYLNRKPTFVPSMKSDQTDPCYNPLKYPHPQQVQFSNQNSKASIKHSSPKLLFFESQACILLISKRNALLATKNLTPWRRKYRIYDSNLFSARVYKVNCKANLISCIYAACVLGVTILLCFCFLAFTCQQHKRHNKEKEGYQRYYQMMAGCLRVFSKQQIEVATNNFDDTRILGTGGHGKVYMGYLEDNKPVAIKIPKAIEEIQIAEFVNEILLLSQLNHKNIVGLIGCCIEVEAPILVYEFAPNGTLLDLLHGLGRNRPISLDTRLKIALDSAEALDYLHSSTTQSILHGDFKSANILLQDDNQAKVSDFGASNLVPIDDTHVVKDVQGTLGYIDPEYCATQILTKKSDVYSFGVVLLELITRKYAIFSDQNQTSEIKNLALCFVSNSSENELNDLLDKDIVTNDENVIKILQEVSQLAIWCVSAKGEDRPTMKQVMEKLQYLVRSSTMGPPTISGRPENLLSESMYYTASDTFASHHTGHSSLLEIETRVN